MSHERLAQDQHDTIPDIPQPAENPRLVGHSDAMDRLGEAYRAGKLPHAILLAGPRGIGKATLAYHFANHLLANPDAAAAPERPAAPQLALPLFRQIAQGAHPSVLHLTRPPQERGSGHKSVLTVAEIRRIGRFLGLTAHDGGWRIVIVDPADDMNIQAANALLKNLEEPPRRTLFILIAHALGRILPTIRSRCQVVRLEPLDEDQMMEVLSGFSSELPPEPRARADLLRRAGGSVREALMMTKFGGVEIAAEVDRLAVASSFDVEGAYKVADAISARDAGVAFTLFNQHVQDRLAERARAMAADGHRDLAARLSGLWQDEAEALRQVEIYNLDRRQHAVRMMRMLHAALR